MKTLFTKKQIEKIIDPAFTPEQIQELSRRTPAKEIEEKVDDEGNKYKSVRGSYMKTRLNQIFGFNYDFQIISKDLFQASGEVLVQGRLTIRNGEKTIVKEQFGKHNLTFKRRASGGGSSISNLGNAFKSAATDAFKKCASETGLCWDIYQQETVEPEKVVVPEENYQDKKITERLEHFLSTATSKEDVEEVVENFKTNSDLNEAREALIENYRNKFKTLK